MTDAIRLILTDDRFLGAIFSTIFIILLGYYLRKSNKVSDDANKVLTTILLSVALPALAFNAFMTDINEATFTTGLNSFIFGFMAYIALIILTLLYRIKYSGAKLDSMRGLTIFGSTTFFGIPIIAAFLGSEGTLYANLFNVAYRVFLYSFGFILMSGLRFNKNNIKDIFLNPILIATFLGFFVWIFQDSLPQTTIVSGETINQVSIFRIDQTLPWFFQGLTFLANLSSPLAWLAIGMTLAKISIKDAVKDKDVWIYSFMKVLIMPLIFLVIMYFLNVTDILPLQYSAIAAIIIMLATPPATVIVSFAINFDKESVFSANASLLTTVISVIAIIFWIIVVTIIHGLNLI